MQRAASRRARGPGSFGGLHGGACRGGAVENAGEIAPAALPNLFEAFVRGPGRPREDGLGLGLYIAQQIAQAHGGDVTARSVDGATTLAVTLPRSPVAAGRAAGVRS